MPDPKKNKKAARKSKDASKQDGTKYVSSDGDAGTEKDFNDKLNGKLKKKGW